MSASGLFQYNKNKQKRGLSLQRAPFSRVFSILVFARVKCSEYKHEYLLPFSCKCRHFCPSCHHRRVVEFGEWLCSVTHQIPKLTNVGGWDKAAGNKVVLKDVCYPLSIFLVGFLTSNFFTYFGWASRIWLDVSRML